jgi:hypothetical protein
MIEKLGCQMPEVLGLTVLKDVVVPLVSAAIGAGVALAAGYYTVVEPQREQRRFQHASARFANVAFFQTVKLAASTIISGQPLGAMEPVLRQQMVRFVDILSNLAVPLNRALRDSQARDQFHLMIVELDRLAHGPALDGNAVLFAYGTAATTGLLLRSAERNDCTSILTLLKGPTSPHAEFFRVVVDQVLPPEIRQEIG